MSFIKSLKEIFFPEKRGDEIIQEERSKIKNDISKNFKDQLGFTELEIKEILDIVTVAEFEIEEIKRGLANVNYNNPNTEEDVEKATRIINEISQKMAQDIQHKAKEIMERKKNFQNEKNDPN